ncbi:tripartite tricarboxylate transporter substrate binding protein [Brotaphodocola sp.]|uniref:tripartite tricarboxylate transporter substrate binding protein n=1 Tax=Brotaphodocola sp. TaxID=3073577 RepID=UPI003D7EC394
MFKKGLAVVMAAVMAFSVVGCSAGDSSGKSETSASTEKTTDEKSSGDTTASTVKWPKNVEIVVPASAGGDTDFNARLLAQKLSDKLPANFVVSNVNGNGGATGTRQVKDAANDGSSVLFYHTAFLVNKACKATDYGFDEFQFAAIAGQNVGNVVTVNASLGINSLEDLYNYTKEHPGELKIAAQTGATSYAVALQMKNAGFDLNIVDAGSAADRLAAVLGGHVDVILAAYGSIKDYVKEGTLVPLAMDGNSDLTVQDENIDIKAMKNQGYDIELPFYYFFAFPKGTDTALVDEFNNALGDIIQNDSEYQEKIYSSYYQQPTFMPGEEGLAVYKDIDEMLQKIDFSAK